MPEILAKSDPVETVEVHTLLLYEAFEDLKGIVQFPVVPDYTEFIENLLCYHDRGKGNIPFQNLLRSKANPKLEPLARTRLSYHYPHEWLSPSFITKEDKAVFKSYNEKSDKVNFWKLALYCIAFHHHRNFEPDDNAIKEQIEEIIAYKDLLQYGGEKTITGIAHIKQTIESLEYWPYYFKYVVLFKGILHKCDYAASAHIAAELAYTGKYRDHFTQGLKKKGIISLYDYQQHARTCAEKSIIFIASTGAGKTEYSMNWINGDKAFYLLGLRTAVNAMYDRFKAMFAFDKTHADNVALLHGESIYRLLEEKEAWENHEADENIFQKENRIRQLSAPITIATADQLVPSVFKFPGFEFFYVTASYSKIVIDEIQSFAPEAIASIVVFLQELQKLGARFLLMTATLPPFVKEEFQALIDADVVVEEKYYVSEKRHRIETVAETLYQERARAIIEEAFAQHKKVLVIVNTVKGAQKLYDDLSELYPDLLHARFMRKDRKQKEAAILEETKDPANTNAPCVWIATQIVEASLDIDFDLLLTENATIDALLQRFGRCWRKRAYSGQTPNIYIFEPEDQKIMDLIYDKDLSQKTWQVLQNYSGALVSEEDKQKIIEEVFSDIKTTTYYKKYKELKGLLVLGLRASGKAEARKYFRTIQNNYTVIPEPIWKEQRAELERLYRDTQNKDISREERFKAKRDLYEYTLPVQLFGERQKRLDEIYVGERSLTRTLDIWLLKGVDYSPEKGAVIQEDYADRKNFIL